MPENTSPEQKIRILIPNAVSLETILMPKSDLGKGWERNTFGVIVPSGQVLEAKPSHTLNEMGLSNMSEKMGNGVVSATRGVITDPGDFTVQSTDEEIPITDSTEVVRAINNPGRYIVKSLEDEGKGGLFNTERVTKEIFERERATKSYFDKNTGKTETVEISSPGLMEKYLIEAVNCVSDSRLVNSDAPQHLSSHASELLKKTRLDMEIEVVPEMPDLIKTVVECLNNEKLLLDVDTRNNLYDILEQISIPNSFVEDVMKTMDKMGDLKHDLALKLYFDLKKNNPESVLLVQQKERIEELLLILSGSPQEIYDNYSVITQKANGLISGIDPENFIPAKVGIEIEYRPNYKRYPHGFIPNRFTAGRDMDGTVEIRTNDKALDYGEEYMEALYHLIAWLEDQEKEKLGTLHVHLDTDIHPMVMKLMEGTLYSIREKENGTEIWGMGIPSNANEIINLINFFALGSKKTFDVDSQPINHGSGDLNWNSLLGGYYCSRLSDPDSRLAAILALRGIKNLVLFNPIEILQKFNFDDYEKINRLEFGLNKKQKDLFEVVKRAETNRDNNLSFQEKILLVYTEMLGDEDEELRYGAIRVLGSQTNLSEKVFDRMTELFDSEDIRTRGGAIRVLEYQSNLPEQIIYKMTELLGSEDRDIRYGAIITLRNQSILSERILNKMVEMIGGDGNIKEGVISVLTSEVSLPEQTISKVTELLGGEDEEIRYSALRILENQKNLPEQTISKVTELLGSEDEDIIDRAMRVLENQTNLSEQIVNKVTELLDSLDRDIRYDAVRTLEKQSNLPEQTINKVTEFLSSDAIRMRDCALKVLGSQTNLSEKVADRMMELLKNEDGNFNDGALRVLKDQTSLPEQIVNKVVELLGNEDESVRYVAMRILENQTSLSEQAFNKVTELLGNEEDSVRYGAIRILESQTSLPEQTIYKMIELLGSEDEDFRYSATRVLEIQANLPDQAIYKMMELLDSGDRRISYGAIRALESRANLPEQAIYKMMELLDSEDRIIRYGAIRALENQTSLPEQTISKVTELLDSEDRIIRYGAIRALENQTSLPEQTINKMTELLGNEEDSVRYGAIRILESQTNLSEQTINKITEMLGDENEVAKNSAYIVLGGQTILSKNTRMKISKLIREGKIVATAGTVALCIGPVS